MQPPSKKIELAPVCPYCGTTAALVTGATLYPWNKDLRTKKFWNCAPCGAYVGCHEAGNGYGDGTRPLGVLANAELRSAKQKAHRSFDGLWKDRMMSRKQAYAWLAKELRIAPAECHIGMFSLEQCSRVSELCAAWWAEAI